MNRDKRSEEGKRPKPERPQAEPEAATPSTDMQPEDAGTPASGNSGRGTAAEPALKQTSKTPAETGGRR
jgi:hypothetical protein